MYTCEKNIKGEKGWMDRDWLDVNKRLLKGDVTSVGGMVGGAWPQAAFNVVYPI